MKKVQEGICNFDEISGCMNAMELKTYEILKDKLGEEKAATILGFVHGKVDQVQGKIDQQKEVLKEIFLTKEDKVELITRMKEDKMDLIKWMIGFWIVQIAAIIGLYLKK